MSLLLHHSGDVISVPPTVSSRKVATTLNRFPTSLSNATSNRVAHNVVPRYMKETTSRLYFTYVNYWIGNGGEYNSGFAFDLRASVIDSQGVIQQIIFPQGATATLADGSMVTGYADGVFTQNSWIKEINRRHYTGSGDVQWLQGLPLIAWQGGGVLYNNDTATDLTALGVGRGAQVTVALNGNAIGSMSIQDGGEGYQNTSFTFAYLLTKEAGGKDAFVLGVVDGNGAIAGQYNVNNGSGFTKAPDAYIQTLGNTPPSDTVGWGASIIACDSSNATRPSMVLLGDSIAAGYTSTDGFGDVTGHFGVYERSIGSQANVMNLAVSSMYAGSFVHTKQYAALDEAQISFDYAMLQFGINDVVNGQTFNGLADTIKAHADEWRSHGASIIIPTLLPATFSSDGFATTANQVPRPGCDASGVRTNYNSAIRNQSDTRLASDVLFDLSANVEDSGNAHLWKVNAGFALTQDGLHLTGFDTSSGIKTSSTYDFHKFGIGIDYAVTHTVTPSLA